jgi:hypothetical protein
MVTVDANTRTLIVKLIFLAFKVLIRTKFVLVNKLTLQKERTGIYRLNYTAFEKSKLGFFLIKVLYHRHC